MNILTIGSLNLDFVYSVDHINLEGETISSKALEMKLGGKGLNQAIALSKAGANCMILGCIGSDGKDLKEALEKAKVDIKYLHEVADRSGHAIIQLAKSGANAIVIYGGANLCISKEMIDEALNALDKDDFVLLQNETSNVAYAIKKAKEKGLKVAFNPSPISKEIFNYPIELVDYLILNEVEGRMLANIDSEDPYLILEALSKKYPKSKLVLTLGAKGVIYKDKDYLTQKEALKDIEVVDTTGAGDTFCGYFLASILNKVEVKEALRRSTIASAIAIGIKGASNSIPSLAEVLAYEE